MIDEDKIITIVNGLNEKPGVLDRLLAGVMQKYWYFKASENSLFIKIRCAFSKKYRIQREINGILLQRAAMLSAAVVRAKCRASNIAMSSNTDKQSKKFAILKTQINAVQEITIIMKDSNDKIKRLKSAKG